MNRPRVLFLDHVGVLGGAELYLADVARSFHDTSMVVLFEDGPFAERLRSDGVAVEVESAPAGFLDVQKTDGWASILTSVPGLIDLTRRVADRAADFDLLFANSQKSLFVAGLAGWVSDCPVVWNLHDILTASRFGALPQWATVTATTWLTNRVIVNSEATREAFVQIGGCRDKTRLVYNGIDIERFETAPRQPDDWLQDCLDVPSSAPLVGMFSRLAPWKGQHVLVEAIAELPGTHAVLVGDSLFRGDEPYEDRLRRSAHRHQVEDRVHFLGFRDDIPRLMHAVDVVVHASTAPEPFGRVIVEGMLAGRPVVATRAGGAREIIDHGETGLLTPPDDSDALAQALDRLLSNPDAARSLARAGRRHAQRRFSLQTMRDAIAAVIRSAAASPSSSSVPIPTSS